MRQEPSIGRVVHYVAYGTPNGEYKPEHRAAIITSVFTPVPGDGEQTIALCVLNPTGVFFNQNVPRDDTGQTSASWHFPEII